MAEYAFEHADGFEQGELAGQVRLGKFEAHYEEIFAEVIEDGVITPEERARLSKAADALGLDRARLRRLEEALQAAYEIRHHVRVREVADEEAPPASIVLSPQAAQDPRIAALELRVRDLTAQVEELTRELALARSQVAVEVDLSNLAVPSVAPGGGVEAVEESAEDLARRLRSDPRDVASLHGLFRIHGRAGDVDRQWLMASVLLYLEAADDAERAMHARHAVDGLIKPSSSLTQDGWRLLFHPDEELLTGQIFAVIVPAVLLGRISTLRREKALPPLDPARKQDPKVSTLQAVRCFSWAGSILGLGSPPLYADPDLAGIVEMVPGVPPATRLGQRALSGRSPFELAFLAGQHLSYFREEHFIRLIVPTIPDLEDLFLAALSIANAGIPLSSEVKRRVGPIARAIEPVLEPATVDRLRGHFLRFIEEGGRTNLQRWATAAERTAARAGLLLANDLRAAHAVFDLEDRATPESVRTKMDDLIVFCTSDRYAKLRAQIGLALRKVH
ncbi:MAG TPA: hypothetical protein VHV30_17650 [Polyangiaceae bacterium]|jgi:hypothetical protein|nr:hypothetical protein [Polyangiaceae bacterium]